MNKFKNTDLQIAKRDKIDEFYTQLADIEKELKFYTKHFENKTVICNCDDPRISNFFHYFSYNFEKLKLKKVISICFKNNQVDLFSKNNDNRAIYIEYNGDKNQNRIPDLDEIGIKQLEGDGDFRSKECIDLLKQADIVVTNPPFSLFREYIAQLVKYKKKFLIIGNVNALTYKEVFPLFKDNKIWFGQSIKSGDREFGIPKDLETRSPSLRIDEQGNKYIRIMGVRWFTNLDFKERHSDLILYKKYNPKEYPKYDNFDAININKTSEIPIDYDGPMGVPITFMDKFNPEQFEIVGNLGSYAPDGYSMVSKIFIENKKIYKRILIKKK